MKTDEIENSYFVEENNKEMNMLQNEILGNMCQDSL